MLFAGACTGLVESFVKAQERSRRKAPESAREQSSRFAAPL